MSGGVGVWRVGVSRGWISAEERGDGAARAV